MSESLDFYIKKILGIVILSLFLITPSQADDIRDFQIEGMSLEDSLLDFMNKDEIKKGLRQNQYVGSDGKFVETNAKYTSLLKTYDSLAIVYKQNDKNYTINSLGGIIFFDKNLNACFEKQKLIEKDFSNLFKNLKKKKNKLKRKGNEGFTHNITYWFESGDAAEVTCYENNNSYHYLLIAIDKLEFREWVLAYNKN